MQALRLSGNKVEVINDRVENVEDLSCDILVARAFASVNDILTLTKNILIKDKMLLLKGRNVHQELENVKCTLHKGISDGYIVEVKCQQR